MSQFIPSVRDNPHCLICNSRVGVSTRNSVQVFNKQVLTCSERPMDIIISGVVGKILKEDNVQSHLICKKCYKLFMEYDELETRLAEIKSEIVANYKRTLLKYKQSSSIEEENELKEITIKKEPEEDAKDECDTGKKITNVLAQKKEQTLSEQNVKQPEHPEMGDIEEQLEKMHASAEDMEVDEVVERVEVIQDADECTENVPQISIPETSDADDTSHSFHGFTQTDEPVDAGAIDNSDDSDYQPPLILEVIQNGESNGEKQNGEDNTAALLEAAAMAEQTIQEDGSLVYNVKIEPDIMYDDVKQLMRRKVGVRKLLKPKNDEYLEPIVSRDGALYTCLACDGEEKAIGDGKSMMLHVKTVHDLRVYICDVCGDDFRKRNELSLHLDEHVATEEGDFQCEICNRIFCNLRLFRIHKRMHYPQSKLWTCETCGKRYSSRNLLDEHINTHTGIRPYVCNVCSKDFASKYTFRAHMKTHEVRPRPFSCSQCEKTFLSQQNLTQHERTHTGIKDYVCHLCGKAFGSPHNLEVHSIVHTGYKPFICRTCGKAFARKAEIRDHERTHTGERPYQCEFCGATFSQRSNLQSHKRATHYDDKRYKCRECGKGFKRRRLLDYHMKAVHTGERPFKCNVCDATFVYPEHFKKHRRIHTGEKPFLCEVCGKAFNSRDNRNAHRFVHSDKKPYECLVCGMGFMRKPLLYAHMETQGHLNDTIVVNQPRLTTEDDQVVTFNIEGEMEMVNADPDDQDPDASEDTKVYIAGLKDHVIIQNTDEGTVIVGTAASDGNEIDQDAVEHLIIDGQVHYTTRSEDGGTEVHEISDGDLTREQILNDSGEYEEVITDQLVEENSQMIQTSSGPIHLVQVRLNNSDGEEQDAWVNLVTE